MTDVVAENIIFWKNPKKDKELVTGWRDREGQDKAREGSVRYSDCSTPVGGYDHDRPHHTIDLAPARHAEYRTQLKGMKAIFRNFIQLLLPLFSRILPIRCDNSLVVVAFSGSESDAYPEILILSRSMSRRLESERRCPAAVATAAPSLRTLSLTVLTAVSFTFGIATLTFDAVFTKSLAPDREWERKTEYHASDSGQPATPDFPSSPKTSGLCIQS